MIRLICFFTIMVSLKCFGQSQEPSALYLSNYTFSEAQPVIGYVKIRSAKGDQIQSLSLGGEHARMFRLSKDHRLAVRKQQLKPDWHQLQVVLTATTFQGATIQDTFRVVRNAFIRNKVIAHRGAWKNTGVPENSLAALQQAIAMGCEGSEFDVHMSMDSVLFIHHDPHVQGVSIALTAARELKGLTLANGEPLPSLQSYLQAGTGQNKTKLILEIKASELGKAHSLALTQKTVALVEQLQAQAWVDYISFDYQVCKEVMRLAPYAKVAYLMGDKTPAQLAADHFFGLDYHFSVLEKKPDWIKQAQQNKLTVNIWTVNNETMMEALLKEKVDFITTNEPELLLQLVTRQ